METFKARRRVIKTQPPERYAALLASRAQTVGTRRKSLKRPSKRSSASPTPRSLESVLLPGRVDNYRPELLDNAFRLRQILLAHRPRRPQLPPYEDIDWDAELSGNQLDGTEKRVFDALQKRGASFAQRLVD